MSRPLGSRKRRRNDESVQCARSGRPLRRSQRDGNVAESRLLDLVSEVGEAAKAILKETDYGRTEFQPTAEWADELGDTLFALICLANATGVDLEKALDQVLEKYRDRLGATGDPGSSR